MDDERGKEIDVTELTIDDLKSLSDAQIRVVQRIKIDRDNGRARDKVKEALKGEDKRIAEAMTAEPYVYISPEIRVMAGCSVRYSSLMRVQLTDAHRLLDEFVANQNPNDMRTSDFFNEALLSHSLSSYNGQDFGGVCLDAGEYQELRHTSPDKARELLVEVREKRRLAIEALSPHVVQRLIEFYQAFQFHVEVRTKDMEEVLGN
jgi:hypothetical protein